ncbi:hypothetical protein Tco_0795795 [Tanacetum coccineum]
MLTTILLLFGADELCSKAYLFDQQSFVLSVYQTSGRSDNILNVFEKKARRKMNYNNQQPARFDRRKIMRRKPKTDSVPCKSKATSVPAGSRNSSASVIAGGSAPANSRNRPAVNYAGRPNPTRRVGQAAHLATAQSNPAGWSKRPAPVSAGRPVSAGWLNPAARPYFRPSSVYFNNMYDPMYMNEG